MLRIETLIDNFGSSPDDRVHLVFLGISGLRKQREGWNKGGG